MSQIKLTQAELDALEKCRQILDEHMGHWLLVTHHESEDDKRESAKVLYHGGALMAKALAFEVIDQLSGGRGVMKEAEGEEEED